MNIDFSLHAWWLIPGFVLLMLIGGLVSYFLKRGQ